MRRPGTNGHSHAVTLPALRASPEFTPEELRALQKALAGGWIPEDVYDGWISAARKVREALSP